MNDAELDRAYNARANIPDHPVIFERWREASLQARRHLRCDESYRYGSDASETFDWFPARQANAPVLAFLHGGYWRAMDKSDFSFIAPAYVEAGVSVAVLNYGLAPATTLAEMVRQTLHACAWLRRHVAGLGGDPDRISLAGHSAGAHLAAMMVAAEWPVFAADLPSTLVHGVVSISGLFDLLPVSRAPFLRNDLRLSASAARHVSPVSYLPRHNVPLVTAVGSLESAEFHRQTRLIQTAWPHCFIDDVPLQGRNHFTAVDALADPAHPLFRATLKLVTH
ncbi:MAG: alpha/beta hydrolase [Rhodocyclaceae bacterium]|nr:alpha/beta hydrolase [Rhodocyclaceae bacterium]